MINWLINAVVGTLCCAGISAIAAPTVTLGNTSINSAASRVLPAVALYYAPKAPLNELKAFDIVVVEPDHGDDPKAYRRAYSELYAYVAIGEVQPSRPYSKDIPADRLLTANADWGSRVIDLSWPEWPDFVADRIVEPLWAKGYRGFFLDTLDSYRLAGAGKFDEAAQQRGLIAVIERLHQRFPNIQLILNRGFEVVPVVRDKIQIVAAESLFKGWNATDRRYVDVPEADREWVLGQLHKVRDEYGIPVLAIDYVAPEDRAATRATAARIQQLGIIPWVADGALGTLGIGSREVLPRRIAVVQDSREASALNYSEAHRLLEMPINHLGYIADHIDINQPLPMLSPATHAGIVVWINGTPKQPKAFNEWLLRQISLGLYVFVIGQPPFVSDEMVLKKLGLAPPALPSQPDLRIVTITAEGHGEGPPPADLRQVLPWRLVGGGSAVIELADRNDRRYASAAITPWGGFVLPPFVVRAIAGTDKWRWQFEPFLLLTAALRLPPMPVPDVTTESGRRLMFAHIDGDGFPSRAELPGAPLAGRVLLDEILSKYRIPHAMSVIEAEVSTAGLYPKDGPEMEEIVRRMFALPHVEVASHSYSHPFRWDNTVRHGVFSQLDASENYHLAVPGYQLDLTREIVGSMNYMRRLTPPDKPAKLMLWSGDTAPSSDALRITAEAGFLNLNGGESQITRSNPTMTDIAPIDITKNGYRQIYAPIANENIYTDLWRGPFYGYRRVIETFTMTETPRRLTPIDIYYHVYSASKKASLMALNDVYRWAIAQPTHSVFPTTYVRAALDFDTTVIARDSTYWRIRNNGELRTLRVPIALGQPDLNVSQDIAGYITGSEGRYVHLAKADALLAFADTPRSRPYLREANARVNNWQNNAPNNANTLSFRLEGQQALEFSLAAADRCIVTADRQPLSPRRRDDDILYFRLNHAAATIEARCR